MRRSERGAADDEPRLGLSVHRAQVRSTPGVWLQGTGRLATALLARAGDGRVSKVAGDAV